MTSIGSGTRASTVTARTAALGTAAVLALSALVVVAPAEGAAAAAPSAVRAAAVATFRTPTFVKGWLNGVTNVGRGTTTSVTLLILSAHTRSRTVLLQRRLAGAVPWTTVTTRSTSSAGRVVLGMYMPAAGGRYQFRMYVPATATVRPTTTGIRTLTAPKPAATYAVSAGSVMVRLVNAARAVSRTCGTTRFPAAAPLAENAALGRAAVAHAADMATHNYFSHTGRTGSTPTTRAQAAGYHGVAGENIAAGYPSIAAVMAGWLASPGHCSNIMSRSYQDIGVGSAHSAKSTYGTYWVQDFGVRG